MLPDSGMSHETGGRKEGVGGGGGEGRAGVTQTFKRGSREIIPCQQRGGREEEEQATIYT